jgi:hypothetical protein
MYNSSEEKPNINTPHWLINMLPFISAVLGGGALWYTWLKYNDVMNQSGFLLYGWIRLAFMLLIGILCLVSTILFILGKSSGWSVFMGGLSMVPLMLFTNLVILVFRFIQNIVQGNAQPFFDHLFTQPENIAIPIVVIALVLFGFFGKREKIVKVIS